MDTPDARVDELVHRWLQQRHAPEKVSLEQLCKDAPELMPLLARALKAVLELERRFKLSISAINSGEPEADSEQPRAPRPLPLLPGYEILSECGRGGMGVVYRARHISLNRTVAIKMILAGGHAGTEALRRFRAEAEAIALLHHPHIVQIYEIGECDGLAFLSLEFVDGSSLEKKLAGVPQNAREAAQLVCTLAAAIEAAHGVGIVHRDLKPGNILLDRSGNPKVADFGLAKRLDSSVGPKTRDGAIMGTPSYMAPEQAEGKLDAIGPATDVYALGAILYEALTGRPPFKANTPMETIRQVMADEAVPVRLLQRRTPIDLETICHTCMQKEPAKRYASAAALARDLQCFLEGRPIQARPVSTLDRGLRWCRRNPLPAGLLAAVALTLIVGITVAWVLALRAEASAAHARTKEQAADKARGEAEISAANALNKEKAALESELNAKESRADALAQAKIAKENARRATAERERAEGALGTAQLRYYAAQISLAQQEWAAHRGVAAWFHLENSPPEFRNWEYYHLAGLFNRNQVVLHRRDTEPILVLKFRPDGKRLLSGSANGTVQLWNLNEGGAPRVLKEHSYIVSAAVFSADGKRVATASLDKSICIWDVEKLDERPIVLHHRGALTALAFSADSKLLAAGCMTGEVAYWPLNPPTEAATVLEGGHGKRVQAVAFDRESRRLASASDDKTVRLWNLNKPERPLVIGQFTDRVTAVEFTSDGRQVAAASTDNTVRFLDAENGRAAEALQGNFADLTGIMEFSADARYLVCGSSDGSVRLWDLRAKQSPQYYMGHTKGVTAATVSADGKRLAAASNDGTLRLWHAGDSQEPSVLKGHTRGPINELSVAPDSLAFSVDGKRIAGCAAGSKDVRVWELGGESAPHELKGHTDEVAAAAFSPNGKRLATGSHDRSVRLWDVETYGPPLVLQGHNGRVGSVAFSPDGKWLASASHDGTARIWDAEKGAELFVLKGHTNIVLAVAFSADGKRVSTASGDGTLRVWDLEARQGLHILDGRLSLFASMRGAQFNSEGTRLAGSTLDNVVRLWDADPKRKRAGELLKGQSSAFFLDEKRLIAALAMSADGKFVASALYDGTVRLWDVENEREPRILRAHSDTAATLVFSPDGRRLVSGSLDGTIQIWDVERGIETMLLRGHTGGVSALVFSRDGARLASAAFDDTLRVWDAPRPQPAEKPK